MTPETYISVTLGGTPFSRLVGVHFSGQDLRRVTLTELEHRLLNAQPTPDLSLSDQLFALGILMQRIEREAGQ